VRSPKEYPPETEGAGFNTLLPDTAYTMRELIEKTAVLSANDAAWLLLNHLDGKTLDDALDLLGLPADLGQILDVNYALSPRDYGVFFRVLYNATYLNRDLSQYALELFTQSRFKQGLVAGIPEGARVAHKFGIRPLRKPGKPERWALHDAGIVYHPRRPYLLCVMTMGCEQASLERSIAAISSLVWDKVEESTPPLPR
jgi:beta-lactamase class A